MNRIRLIAGTGICLAALGGGLWLGRQVQQQHRNSELIRAIRQDNARMVRNLLSEGANPNAFEPSSLPSSFWRQLLDRLQGRHPASDQKQSALSIALGLNPTGMLIDTPSSHCDAAIIAALLRHGARLDPTNRSHPWNNLRGWILDGGGYGLVFSYPQGASCRLYLPKEAGTVIISAFRKAGLKPA